MSDTDSELLARYTRQHADDAFAELVRRHLSLVYSAALRQARSPQLAEEVTQSAFIKLARQAHRLEPDTILTAWLYQVTRHEAIDVVRREASRQLREQIATEMNAMNATAADWTHIEPLLDEAMHALDETDRTAVLLRYFENKSLREVGVTLGTSENAAQKRLGRAVERLREFFTKRGVTVGASGLVVVISANAVQAAPIGLAVTLSTAAVLGGTTLTTTATATATKAIAMTVTQKVLITAVLATAVGTAIYEARQASSLRREVQSFQEQQRTLAEQNDRLSRDRDDATNRLALLADPIARPPLGRQVLPVNAATVAVAPTPEPIIQDDVMNEHVKAVTDYTKALEAAPKAFSPRFNRGGRYEALKQFDNAIADYTKIIDDPDIDFSLYGGGRTNGISRAYEYRGRAYQNHKDYAKALADYDEALRMDPTREAEDETNIQWRRGLCYRALQQDDNALEVANLLSGRALQWAMTPGDMNWDYVNSAQTSARFGNEILGHRGHRQPFQLEVCAAVAAKNGDFHSAVASQQEALRALSPAAEAQRPAMQARLERYQAGKPLSAE